MLASAQARGEVALAFGRDRVEDPDDYLTVDLVAMWLKDKLSALLGRRVAAETVRFHWMF